MMNVNCPFGISSMIGTLLLLGHTALCTEDTQAAPIPDNKMSETTGKARMEAISRWQNAKFGLFMHWGVYSVYGGTYKGKAMWSAEWIQENARIPWKEYAETAAEWNPAQFDAEEWVKIAKSAGMKYIVITAKHHDGFAMYPSKASSYNIMESTKYRGPDPLAALKAACKKHGLLFGVYYSPLEFRLSPDGFDAADEKAVKAGFSYQTLGPKPYASNADVVALAKKQIKELCQWYKPDILWFDGTWDKMGTWAGTDAREAEQAIRAELPNVIINNRLGAEKADFNTYEGKLPDKAPGGAWEYCWNLGVFWGYNPSNYDPKHLQTPAHYIETLVKATSLGGNYLLNVGPDSTGRFHPMAVNYLTKIGQWVNANGECIYGASGSPLPGKPAWGYVTARPDKLYLIVKDWTATITVPSAGKAPGKAYLLLDADKKSIPILKDDTQWTLSLTQPKPTEPFAVVVVEIGALTVDQ